MNSTTSAEKRHTALYLGLIVAATVVAFARISGAGFLAWDDSEYILQNDTIRTVSIENISAWFKEYFVGNYHPLTIASYAVDHLLGGLNPFIYHFTNIFLHVINSCLVFLFIRKLCATDLVALFVALLFALHPMQTESVSWVAERKTVLSSLFYLLALIQYLRYAAQPSGKQLIWVLLYALAALLSKGTAVALPLAMIAVDVWLNRDLKVLKTWTEKLPVYLLSLVFGIVALKAQTAGKFIDVQESHSIIESGLYGGYAYVQYIIRWLLPVNLSAMYPYPVSVGIAQYVLFTLSVVIVALIIISYRKGWIVLCGGLLFYTANIVLLLQFVPFGEALMADRYMYLAGIGLAYPLVFYSKLVFRQSKRLAVGFWSALTVILLLATIIRNGAWMSDMNFFNALLKTFPNSAVAQYSVGALYLRNGDLNNAEIHLDKAVRLEPGNAKAWYNKGKLHLKQGKAMEALEALDHSIAINQYPKAYFTRAILHEATGKTDLALADIEKVLKAEPNNARALCVRGDCLEKSGKQEEALKCYNQSIELSANEPLFYMRRGILFGKMNNFPAAISDLDVAISLNPGNGEALFYRGIFKHKSARGGACQDLERALKYGYKRAKAAIKDICAAR